MPSNGKEELKARTVARKRAVTAKLFKEIGKFSLNLGMGRVYLPMDTEREKSIRKRVLQMVTALPYPSF